MSIAVTAHGDHVRVQVVDDGPVDGWQPIPGAGHGLELLTTQVAALGGTLDAGTAAGGFRVDATIPMSAV